MKELCGGTVTDAGSAALPWECWFRARVGWSSGRDHRHIRRDALLRFGRIRAAPDPRQPAISRQSAKLRRSQHFVAHVINSVSEWVGEEPSSGALGNPALGSQGGDPDMKRRSLAYCHSAGPVRCSRGLEQDDAGVGNCGQRLVAPSAGVESPATGDDCGSQPDFRLLLERLRSGPRDLFRVNPEPAQTECCDDGCLHIGYNSARLAAVETAGQYSNTMPRPGTSAPSALLSTLSQDDAIETARVASATASASSRGGP